MSIIIINFSAIMISVINMQHEGITYTIHLNKRKLLLKVLKTLKNSAAEVQ